MSLSNISIKNPVFAWMLMFGLILFGGLSFSRMGISELPDVDFPVINIEVVYNGASPDIIETDIVDIIEDAIMTVDGIREIKSTCYHSRGSITVELDLDRDVDVALQEVSSIISRSQRLLPPDMDPPEIIKRNPEEQPLLWLSLSTNGPIRDLMVYARHVLRDKLQTIPGVSDIQYGGYTDRNLRIWVNREKLQLYELTVEDIINTFKQENIEVPGGRIENSQSEFIIRSKGEADTVKSIENLPITSRGGAPIYRRILLKDVAEVVDDLDDIGRISRFNLRRSVGLGVMKQRNSNTIQVARSVKKMVEELQPKLPKDYKLMVGIDFTRHIEESTDELIFTIILSVILTSLVCLLFLGSFSSTFNIIFAIPTSLIGTFTILYFLGYTLNIFTLLALTLVIGIVVDDAIMVMENISRYHELGENRLAAAVKGTNQITFAAIAASMAVIAIFLPVAFMDGIIGSYFMQFGITISVAVSLSLLEALTLTPMRCSRFLQVGGSMGKVSDVVNSLFNSMSRIYGSLLHWALDHRIKVIVVSLVIFSSSMLLLIPIKKELVPKQDQSMFFMIMKTKIGSSLEFTDSMTRKVEEYIGSRKDVLRMYSVIGGIRGGQANMSFLFVTLHDPDKRPVHPEKGKRLSQQEIIEEIRKDIKKVVGKKMWVGVRDLSMRGLTSSRGYPVEFTIKGPDWDRLGGLSEKIEKAMKDSKMIADANTNYEVGLPELEIVPDRRAAELRGVSMISIGNTIGAMIGGKKLGKFTDSGHRYDIRLRLKDPYRKDAEDIKKLYVRNNRGELVRLSDVVVIKEKKSMLSITRLNRERSITISGNPAAGFSQQEAVGEALKIAGGILPDGYYYELTGSAKASSESFNSLIFALVIGIIISYMILASQFNSYIHPFTILLSLPFSLTGALIALMLTGQTINLYSFIGLILLMGLVKKNSILLVEFTNQVRKEGMNVRDSLIRACPIRLRPITMTSMSTIAAAIPPALALGPGAETRIPMAVAVLGGIIFSTMLTLFVVPCAYSLLARWEKSDELKLNQEIM